MPQFLAGINVHHMLHVVTAIIEHPDGSVEQTSSEYGGFQRDCRALSAWLAELNVELVVMESTSVYWKSLYSQLERVGIDPDRNRRRDDQIWLRRSIGRLGIIMSRKQ